MAYDNWRKRLEIAKLPTVAARRAELTRQGLNNMEPTQADEGYYRIPITEKHPTNGKNIVTGWVPVAIFMDGIYLVGVKDSNQQEMRPSEVVDQWTWFCTHPVEYEVYKEVAEEGGAWPDAEPAKIDVAEKYGLQPLVPAANRAVERSNNQPPPEEVIPPDVEHATAIDNAIGAAKDLPVTTVAEAAIAAGAANVIRDRRLTAEKVAKSIVDPLHRAYTREREKWLTPVTRAKTAEDGLRLKVRNFEADERKRVAAEQLAALERQREIDEAAERAADRAIAAGQPELAPVVEEVAIPKAPERVQPTYGSYKPREKPILKFAVITDPAAVLNHYKLYAEVIELIQKLATKDIRAGLEVPGATFREGTE